MGKLTTYRENRAKLRAHASALKATAQTEAKLAAKEARQKAREGHRVDLTEAKERAKLARRTADRKAKREEKLVRREGAVARKGVKRNRKAEAALSKDERATLKKEAKLVTKDRRVADKIDSVGRKHEYKLAQTELRKIEAGKFGKKDVQRWLSVAKVATPVVLPLLYKAVSSAQGSSSSPSGVGSVDLQQHGIDATGPGAALGARVVRLEQTLDQLETTRGDEGQIKDFISSTRTRLTDLRAAIETAESTPTAQRREVHSSISGELDRVHKDVLARLGVKA